MQTTSQAFILHLQITEKDRREGGGKTDRSGERNAGRGSGGGEHRAGGTPRGGGTTWEGDDVGARRGRRGSGAWWESADVSRRCGNGAGEGNRRGWMREEKGRRDGENGRRGAVRERGGERQDGAADAEGGKAGGARCRGRDEAGEKRERGPGGAQEARRGKRWERVLEGGWTMERAEGQTCRNGMRGGGAESRMQKHRPSRPNSPALLGSGCCIVSRGPFGSIPRLPLGMRDKQIKGGWEIISPGGVRGGVPHARNTGLRGRTAPRCPEPGAASEARRLFLRLPFGIRNGQIKGVRGKLFPPAGRGAEPHIPKTPACVISG